MANIANTLGTFSYYIERILDVDIPRKGIDVVRTALQGHLDRASVYIKAGKPALVSQAVWDRFKMAVTRGNLTLHPITLNFGVSAASAGSRTPEEIATRIRGLYLDLVVTLQDIKNGVDSTQWNNRRN